MKIVNISNNASIMSNREFFRQKEAAVLYRIPGVYEIINSNLEQKVALENKYPDACFALFIASNLFFHDSELTGIHMTAYYDLLNGKRITDIRFRYEKAIQKYSECHMWDR